MTTTLYRLYTHTGELLYVGISLRWPRRFSEHRKHQPWWPDTATVTLEHHLTRAAAEKAERDAIATEHPTHNVTHQTPGNPAPTHLQRPAARQFYPTEHEDPGLREVRSVPCPVCGAAPFALCVAVRGKDIGRRISGAHGARYRTFDAARPTVTMADGHVPAQADFLEACPSVTTADGAGRHPLTPCGATCPEPCAECVPICDHGRWAQDSPQELDGSVRLGERLLLRGATPRLPPSVGRPPGVEKHQVKNLQPRRAR